MGAHFPCRFQVNRQIAEPCLPDGHRAIAQPAAIRIATPSDRLFVDALQKRHAGAVGFLPGPAIENLIGSGDIRIAEENDDPAGYILSRHHLRWQPAMRSITQACVAMDAQRRHHGLALLEVIASEARASGLLAIQANCAVGLDANEFWSAAGFIPICHMTPENCRGREIICWRKPLTSVVPIWFAMPPKYAGHRAAKPQSIRDHFRSMDATNFARRHLAAKTDKEATNSSSSSATRSSSGDAD